MTSQRVRELIVGALNDYDDIWKVEHEMLNGYEVLLLKTVNGQEFTIEVKEAFIV